MPASISFWALRRGYLPLPSFPSVPALPSPSFPRKRESGQLWSARQRRMDSRFRGNDESQFLGIPMTDRIRVRATRSPASPPSAAAPSCIAAAPRQR